MSNAIPIATEVALLEAEQLIGHYQNRNLLLSQAAQNQQRRIAELEAELAALKAQPEVTSNGD